MLIFDFLDFYFGSEGGQHFRTLSRRIGHTWDKDGPLSFFEELFELHFKSFKHSTQETSQYLHQPLAAVFHQVDFVLQ